MLLAIDTSAGTSVAIVDVNRGVLAEHEVHDTRRHAEVIGQLILACLTDSVVAIPELTGVAVGMGPGPFTGLRVGIAAAQAFALGANRPLLRVVSHDAIAFAHYASGGAGPLLVTTDARRHERYWSAYRGTDRHFVPERVEKPGLARPDALEALVTDYGSYRRLDADWVSAASIGQLAQSVQRGEARFVGPDPLYLRSPDVTPSAGPKRVTA